MKIFVPHWIGLLSAAMVLCLISGRTAYGQGDPILDLYRQAQHLAVSGDYSDALEKSRQALQLAEKELGSADCRLAPLINELASILYRLGRYREAAACFERALTLNSLSLPAADPRLAVNLANLAAAYRSLGRLADAENLQRQALRIDQLAQGPNHPRVAEDLNNLAAILQEKGAYPEALELLRESLAILQNLPDLEDVRLAGLNNNIGLLYKLQGEFPRALFHYEAALRHGEKGFGDNHPEVSRIAANLGILYKESGDIRQAEQRFRQALAICRENPGAQAETALVLNGFASLLAGQDRMQEARSLYLQALQRQIKVLGPEHGTVAALYNNLGELELRDGNLGRAEEYLVKARDLCLGAENAAAISLAAVLHNLARVHAGQDRLQEAEEELRQALRLTGEALGRDHYQNASLMANLADILKRRGSLDEAVKPLQQALLIARAHLPSDHPQLAELLNSLGALHFALNRLDEANRFSLEAAEIVQNRLHFQQISPRERRLLRHILQNRVSLLWHLAEGCPKRRSDFFKEAFETAQWAYASRAGIALAQLTARFAAGEGDLAGMIRQRQDCLERQSRLEGVLEEYLISFTGQRNFHEEQEVRRQLTAAGEELTRVTARLEQVFTRYFELERPSVVSAEETRQHLGPKEGLLFFLSGELESHLWWVTPNELIMRHVPLGAEDLKWRVSTLLRGLNQSDVIFVEDVRPFNLELSRQLYHELFGPLETHMEAISRLITVVDGDLLRLPLSVLTPSFDEGTSAGNHKYRTAEWLIDRFNLTRLPTVSGLVQLRQGIGRSLAGLPFVGFGDPLLTEFVGSKRGREGTPPGAKGVTAADVRSLPGLPDSGRELKAVAGLLGAGEDHLFLGKEATEARLRALPLNRYRVLAFASHALQARDLPSLEEPALVLTPPEGEEAGEDGLLTAGEIADLKLDADLVILSACNTAAGDGDGGEGLSGLARAFFYAGSRGVMASHWPVGSAATSKLITRFVGRWQRHPSESPVEALAAAMRETRLDPETELSHPLFWAPFLIIGAPEIPLKITGSSGG